GVIENLPRYGVEVHAGLEAAYRAQVQRKEIKEEGTFRFRGQRDHLALLLLGRLLVNVLQVGGFTTKPSAVIDDLAVDLAGCEIYETQTFPQDLRPTPPKMAALTQILQWFLTDWFYTTCARNPAPSARLLM